MRKLLLLCLLSMGSFMQAQTTSTVTSPWPSDAPEPDREIYTYSRTSDDQFVINWEMSIPFNGTFLDETSYSGGRIDYKHFIDGDNLAVGVSLGWNTFNDYVERQLYEREDGSGAIYTDMVRHVYNLPIAINGYYFFAKRNLKPYVGLGLGTMYSEQTSYFNIYGIQDSNWGFLVKPELGLQLEMNSSFGIASYVSYNYSTNSNQSFNIDKLVNLNIGLGIYWEW